MNWQLLESKNKITKFWERTMQISVRIQKSFRPKTNQWNLHNFNLYAFLFCCFVLLVVYLAVMRWISLWHRSVSQYGHCTNGSVYRLFSRGGLRKVLKCGAEEDELVRGDREWCGLRPSVLIRTRPVWDLKKIGLGLGLVRCGLGLVTE